MNEIDLKLVDYIKRAKAILGMEFKSNVNTTELLEGTNLIIQVAKMIQMEEE